MVSVELVDPHDLDRYEWRQLQMLYRDSVAATLDRPQDDIDAYVEWDDPEGFYLSHLDPNIEVGKRYNGKQSFSRPRVAIATAAREPVGFMYSANNVSGETEAERHRKQLSVVKNYRWIREVAVAPWIQRHGVAKQLGRHTLLHTVPFQPVSTYIFPDQMPFIQAGLESLGFWETGDQSVHAFGDDRDTVKLVRMQAHTTYGVLARMYADAVRNIKVDYS